MADELGRYMTPQWAAQRLLRRHLPLAPGRDRLLEPSCGNGSFLMAVPAGVQAAGVEIDPALARQARLDSGHPVYCGDFFAVELPFHPTVIAGNPPFSAAFLDALLDRAAELLEEGGRMGLILPVYLFQTGATVMRYSRHFSIEQELLPRNLFPGLEKPILWANFLRQRQTSLSGFYLYEEVHALGSVKHRYKTFFLGNTTRTSAWGELVEQVLLALGGQARLDEIYREIEGRRPTRNPWWREQIRKILHRYCVRVAPGTYALAEALDTAEAG